MSGILLQISEDTKEIKKDINDQLCDMNRIIEEIEETAECHKLPVTNSANGNEVPIPENSSQLLVHNLESPEPRVNIN